MRWGVREEAALDHSASALCMREIKLCQQQSAGPTFVVSTLCTIDFVLVFRSFQKLPVKTSQSQNVPS